MRCRHTFLPTPDGEGVFRFTSPVVEQNNVEENNVRKSKMLERIEVSEFEIETYLQEDEIDLLYGNMDISEIEDDAMGPWSRYYENMQAETMLEVV